MAQILQSNSFAGKDRLCRFLDHVVCEHLAGRSDRLGGYAIGIDVFDRPEDFDPSLDTIVRVEARRLRQVLASYYAGEGRDESVVISLPTGGYAPSIEIRAPQKSKRPGRAKRGPVIAVLPFDDHSSGGESPHFANGLTELLIARLARYGDLSVISRRTMSDYRGAAIADLRDALEIDYAFEGSVNRGRQRIRVNALFIDAVSETHIWAESFDKSLATGDLFDLEDDIADIIAARIADRYGPLGRVGGRAAGGRTGSYEAYSALLLFYDNYAHHLPELHAEARAAVDRAIEADPNFADAWAARAAIHLDEYRFGLNPLRSEMPPLERASNTAVHAAILNPESAMAQQFLACAHFHAGDDASFRVSAEEALRLNPGHADLLADLGTCYGLLGETDRGLQLVRRAIELRPTHPGWYHSLITIDRFMAGDYDNALAEAVRGYMPGFFWSHALKAAIHGKRGETREATVELATLAEHAPDFATTFHDEAKKWRANEAVVVAIADGLRCAGLEVGS